MPRLVLQAAAPETTLPGRHFLPGEQSQARTVTPSLQALQSTGGQSSWVPWHQSYKLSPPHR